MSVALCWKITINSSRSLRQVPVIVENLPQENINKVTVNFTKRSTAYMAVAASSGHFVHL